MHSHFNWIRAHALRIMENAYFGRQGSGQTVPLEDIQRVLDFATVDDAATFLEMYSISVDRDKGTVTFAQGTLSDPESRPKKR